MIGLVLVLGLVRIVAHILVCIFVRDLVRALAVIKITSN